MSGAEILSRAPPSPPSAPKRVAVGFVRDENGDWVAELACGHRQHVRHRPPWQSRLWTTTLAGRRDKVGVEFDCTLCAGPVPVQD